MAEIWLNHPDVRSEVNKRIAGDADIWPTDWLRSRLLAADALPIQNSVSVGCGTGAFERDIVRKGIALHVTGVDVAPEPLRRARELAHDAALSDCVDYALADAHDFLRRTRGVFDAIFFHESLHHFSDVRGLLVAAHDALRPGGWIYLDEYVGPARNEWTWRRLLIPNIAYYCLPRTVRRPHLIRAPINREDPTEAAESSVILGALAQVFKTVETRPYGGNVLAVVYPNLRRVPDNDSERASFDKAVSRLIALENTLLKLRVKSFYAVALARRSAAPRSARRG